MDNKVEPSADVQPNASEQPASQSGNRGVRFLKDFGIYTIGNLGTKMITFILVPLYTYFVKDPGDYGYFDVCLATCFLLMPIITLQMRDGSYRLLINSKDDSYRKRVVSFVYRTFFASALLCVAIAALISIFMPVRCLWYTLALLITMSIFEIAAQMIRATSDNITYTITVISATVFTLLFAILFVAVLGLGIDGIFLANILSKIVGLAIAEYRIGLFRRYLRISDVELATVGKELMRFSLPLIPTAVCWWLISSSNRFFIMHFIGVEVNGYYAVAARMTTMLHVIGTIFHQTWQENAFRQYGQPEQNKFFTDIFNNFIYVYVSMGILFVFAAKLLFPIVIGPNYQTSISLVYLLGLSTLCGGIGSFFDIAYQCAKQTKRSMAAVFLNAMAVITLNFILIKPLGVYGVITSVLTTYAFYDLYRFYDTKRYFSIAVSPRLLVPLALILASALPFYLSKNLLIDVAWLAVAISILYFAMPQRTKHFITDTLLPKLLRKKKSAASVS